MIDYDSWLLQGSGIDDEEPPEDYDPNAENESKIDIYEEKMNRDMTDSDQDKIDNFNL